MYTGQVAVISNKATWLADTIEIEDEDDGSTVDLASPSYTVAISVYIKDQNGCQRVLGTITNGKVVIDGPGFHWQFEVADLSSLCAGTYICGVKIQIDDFIDDLIIGTVAVVEGN